MKAVWIVEGRVSGEEWRIVKTTASLAEAKAYVLACGSYDKLRVVKYIRVEESAA